MKSNPTVSEAAFRDRVKELLDQLPNDPAAREAWLEHFLGEIQASRPASPAVFPPAQDAEQSGITESERVPSAEEEQLKRTIDALQEENRRQLALVNNLFQSDPSGLAVVYGPELVIQLANDAFRAITLQPEEDPTGQPLRAIWPDEKGFLGSDMLRPVLEDHASLTVEKVEQVYPDGTRRSFTLHARPLPWDEQPALMLVIWETTQLDRSLEETRRRAAEAEEVRRIFEAMMEYTPEAIIIASSPGLETTHISNYAAGLVRLPRPALKNLPLADQEQIWNAYRPDGLTPIPFKAYPLTRAARDGEVVQDEEMLLLQGEQQVRLLCNAGPIRDDQGHVLGGIVVARDITERNRVEAHQRFLSQLGKTLVALTQPADILQGVADHLGQHLGADRCWITSGDPLEGWENLPGIQHEPPVITALRKGKTIVIGDAATDPRIAAVYTRQPEASRLRSLILVPWLDRERHWRGTLVVGSKEKPGVGPRQWRRDEIELAGSVADLTWLALENARLFQDLRDFRQRFEVALRNAPITVYTHDHNLRYTWVFNTGGASGEPMLGKRDDEITTPENAVTLLALKQSVLDTGVGIRQEVRLHREDIPDSQGTAAETIYDMTIEPLRDPQGEINGLTVAAMEVTDQRRMEAEALSNLAQIEVQRRLIHERERERTRIARELHDGPLQDLIATNFALVEAMDVNDKTERLAKMRAIQTTLQHQVQELRRFCYELRPPALGPFGLEKTIHSHAENFRDRFPQVALHLDLEYDGQRLSEELRLMLFRVYQELLNNVVRHSAAENVWVRLQLHDGQAELLVEDDGKGFDKPDEWVNLARQGHLGLVGVKERVEVFGGTVNVETRPGAGTRVSVIVRFQ